MQPPSPFQPPNFNLTSSFGRHSLEALQPTPPFAMQQPPSPPLEVPPLLFNTHQLQRSLQ